MFFVFKVEGALLVFFILVWLLSVHIIIVLAGFNNHSCKQWSLLIKIANIPPVWCATLNSEHLFSDDFKIQVVQKKLTT